MNRIQRKRSEAPTLISPEFRNFSDGSGEAAIQVGNNPWMDNVSSVAENSGREKEAPPFLRVETNLYAFKLIILTLLFLASGGSLAFVGWGYATHQPYIHPGYFVPGAIGGILSLIAIVVVGIKAHFWLKEVHHLEDHFDPNLASNDVRGVYQHLLASFANINWLAAYIYILSALTILLSFTAFYFIGVHAAVDAAPGAIKPVFGSLTYGAAGNANYHTPGIILWVVVGVMAFTLFNQVFWQIFNLVRIKQMDTYYNQPIISPGEQSQIKSYTNKRDLILFLVGTLVLTMAAWFVYRRFKRK